MGKFGGSLAKMLDASRPRAMGVALARGGLSAELIGEVILGQVLAAGAGQNPARQAVIKSGLNQEHARP